VPAGPRGAGRPERGRIVRQPCRVERGGAPREARRQEAPGSQNIASVTKCWKRRAPWEAVWCRVARRNRGCCATVQPATIAPTSERSRGARRAETAVPLQRNCVEEDDAQQRKEGVEIPFLYTNFVLQKREPERSAARRILRAVLIDCCPMERSGRDGDRLRTDLVRHRMVDLPSVERPHYQRPFQSRLVWCQMLRGHCHNGGVARPALRDDGALRQALPVSRQGA